MVAWFFCFRPVAAQYTMVEVHGGEAYLPHGSCEGKTEKKEQKYPL
jgi:hypothetical protein